MIKKGTDRLPHRSDVSFNTFWVLAIFTEKATAWRQRPSRPLLLLRCLPFGGIFKLQKHLVISSTDSSQHLFLFSSTPHCSLSLKWTHLKSAHSFLTGSQYYRSCIHLNMSRVVVTFRQTALHLLATFLVAFHYRRCQELCGFMRHLHQK